MTCFKDLCWSYFPLERFFICSWGPTNIKVIWDIFGSHKWHELEHQNKGQLWGYLWSLYPAYGNRKISLISPSLGFFHFFFLFTFPSLPPFLHPPYPSSHVSLSFSFPLTLMSQPSTVLSWYTPSFGWILCFILCPQPTTKKTGLVFQIFTKRTDFTLFLAFAFCSLFASLAMKLKYI